MDFVHIIANYPDMKQRDAYFNADDVRAFRFEEIDGEKLAVVLVYDREGALRFVSDSTQFLESKIRK